MEARGAARPGPGERVVQTSLGPQQFTAQETDLTLYGVVSSLHCLLVHGSITAVFERGVGEDVGWTGSNLRSGGGFTVQLDNLVVGKTCCEQSKCCVCFCFYRLQLGANGHDVTLDGCQTGEQSRDTRPVETRLMLNRPASHCKHLSFIGEFLLHPRQFC